MEALGTRMESRDQEVRQELAIYLTNTTTLWWHWRFADMEKDIYTNRDMRGLQEGD